MNEKELLRKFPKGKFYPIVVTEVTRMSKGNYCVAAWDVHARAMVRPLQASGANWRLGPNRSVFSPGSILNCVPTGARRSGYPHATEDLLLASPPALLHKLDEPHLHALIAPYAFSSVVELFGAELIDHKFIEDGTRCRSLGGLRVPSAKARFLEDDFGRLRLDFSDSTNATYRLAVTCDWLQHIFSPSDDDAEPHFGVSEANEWIDANPKGSELILRIGLARGWAGKEGQWHPLRCYAQLNGIICPEDNWHIFAGPPAT